MSTRSEVTQGLKQFSERSVDLMRVIRSVSMGEGSAETPEHIMKLLIQTDSALQEAVAKLRHNQEIQGRIDHVQSRIRSREADVRDLALQLRAAETILQGALEETAPCVTAVKQAQQTQGLTSVHDLINYSAKMALTSGKIPGLNPMEPFPGLEHFARSRLMKELMPTRDESTAMVGTVEAEPYVSFLGDVVTSDAQGDEEDGLADF